MNCIIIIIISLTLINNFSYLNSKILLGRLETNKNWEFLARFCFLTERGSFHYDFMINRTSKNNGNVNLLLYYDAPSQWPSVYPSNRTCEDKQSILKIEQGQIVPLSADDYASSSVSGCRKIADCSSDTGLNVTYNISMTNGPPGSFWKEHYSADEFYTLPLFIIAGIAYSVLVITSIYMANELRLRRLLHSTFRLYMISMVCQFIGICCGIYSMTYRGLTGFDVKKIILLGFVFRAWSETSYTLLMLQLAEGYTITKSHLPISQLWFNTWFIFGMVFLQLGLLTYQNEVFDPGLVLYIYESGPGFCLMALKVIAWVLFTYYCFKTCQEIKTKYEFYASLLSLGSIWFLFHPLTVLIITIVIDKWIRESVVQAASLWIIFIGHAFFLWLIRPSSSNIRFPFHIRTTQVVPTFSTEPHNNNYEPSRRRASIFTVQFENTTHT
ncbi:transmembrane protein 145-like isoform X2 [Aphidius gifuensis]|uniref:transmembrane protein 145-like isoform X2 n=1 Tax=Aphidius gifuensis TaxID=684658 RepID=UPI001CDBAF6D|nr:transmembrane protein 145-like isoform X2 [Aphidius gifuensis]